MAPFDVFDAHAVLAASEQAGSNAGVFKVYRGQL